MGLGKLKLDVKTPRKLSVCLKMGIKNKKQPFFNCLYEFLKFAAIGGGVAFALFFYSPIGGSSPAFAASVSLNDPVQSCLVSSRVINISWTSDIIGHPTYHILRKLTTETSYTEIDNTDSLTYTDNTTLSDKNYLYQIKATKGTSTYFSNEKTANANYCPSVLSAPMALCQADGPHNKLSWTAVSGDLAKYEIWRDGAKISETTMLAYDDGPNISATTNYTYFIKSIWQDSTSRDSDTSQATALACPPVLTANFACNDAAPGGPAINLSWNNLLGVARYEVYRKAQSETSYSLLATVSPPSTTYKDNLVESLPFSYWQAGNTSYFIKAIWDAAEKDSNSQEIAIPRCIPFVSTTGVCDEFGNPEMRFSWTKTLGANLYNLYRDSTTFLNQVNSETNSWVDYLDSNTCFGGACTHSYRTEASVTGFPNFVSNTATQSIDCATVNPPTPPPSLNEPLGYCESGKSKISFSWSPSNNVIYYTLYRNNQALVNLSGTSYVDTGVESGISYSYYVIAYGKAGKSAISDNIKTIIAVDCTPPSIPILTLSKTCASGLPRINLSWSATNNTVNYEIKRGLSAGSLVTKIVFNQSSPEYASRSWQDTDVNPSTAYYYQVIANSVLGVTPSASVVSSITTDSCLPAVPNVTLSTDCNLGNSRVKVSWTSDNANTHHYEIFRQDVPGELINTVYPSGTSYSWIDTVVSQLTAYNYKVEAVGYLPGQRTTQGYKPVTTNNCSPPGAFTLTDPPNVYCQGSYPRTDLNWTASSNTTSYDLFRNRLNADDSIAETATTSNVVSPYTDVGFGNALSFDGSNDYINGGSSPSLMPTAVTVEAWIYPTSYSVSYARILEKGGYIIGGGYGLEFNPGGNNRQRFVIWSGTSAQPIDSNVTIPLNKWTHVVGTFSGTMKLYINGLPQTATSSATMTTNTAILSIGRAAGSSSNYFPGIIDEARIYNRALSSAEILQHYQSIYSDESGLVGLWHFDEGAGQSVSDSSNYGNNGTLYSGTTVCSNPPTAGCPTWIQSGLQSETKYSWQTKAIGPGGTTLSNTTSPTTLPLCLPTKPGLVLSSFCEGGANPAVRLNWSYSINTSIYEIYREGALINPINTVSQSDPKTWIDNNGGTGLDDETSYTYYIKAVGPTGINQSDSRSITTPLCVLPTKPENLTAAFSCSGSYPRVNLEWDTSSNATGYSIYRNINGGSYSFLPATSPITCALGKCAYTDVSPSVNVNTAYSYYIVATGPGGASFPSDPVSTTTGYCTPSTPSITSLTTGCESNAPVNTISWSDATASSTFSYKIYRNTTGVSPPESDLKTTITSAMPEFSSRTWKDNLSLSSLTLYYYWVKALGPAGESPLSASTSITTYGCGITPSSPTLSYNLFCEDNLPYASTSWTPITNAYSYNLYRENITDGTQSVYSTALSPKTDEGARSLKFDGVDDFVDVPYSISTYNGVTAESWVKLDGFSDTYGTIYLLGSQSSSQGFHWLYIGSGGIYWQYGYGTGYSSKSVSVSWNIGQWYHVAVSHDYAKKEIKFYRDGISLATTTHTESVLPVLNKTSKVGAYSANNYRLKGSSDEVRFYNRVLSSTEISEHKNGIYKNETYLEGVWHFDERLGATVFDSSGNNRHGTIAGPEWAYGKSGKALDFGALDSYVNGGYVDVGNVNPTTAITVEAWVKSATTTGYSGIYQIISKYNAYILGTDSTGGKNVCFLIYNSSGWQYGSCYTVPDPQNWHHFVGTYDSATAEKKLYVDGVLRSTTTPGGTIYPDTGPLNIGRRESSNGYNFKGEIDEVRIYARALTLSEIQEHFNGTFNNEADLKGLWHFDEGEGTTTYDNSGNGNNGTLIKGAQRVASSDILNYVSPLEGDKTYKYYVKAFGADTESGPSNEVSFVLSCLPAKPIISAVPECVGANTQIALSWPADSNTSYWNIYKKRSSETAFNFLITTTLTSYPDINVESGVSYDYYTVAYGQGASSTSDPVTAIARSDCYDAPVKPIITVTPQCAGTTSRMKIIWAPYDNSKTLSFNIYRQNTTIGEAGFTKIYENLPGDRTEFIDGAVLTNNKYIYKIEAVGSGASNSTMSDPSSEQTTIDCLNIPPFYPPVLSLNFAAYSVSTGGAASLRWTDAQNETSYEIFRRIQGESEFAFQQRVRDWKVYLSGIFAKIASAAYTNPLATLLANTDYIDPPLSGFVNYIDQTVVEDTNYEYQIRAINNAGATNSNIIPVYVPIAPPGAFTLSYSRISQNKINLIWTEAISTVKGGSVAYTVQKDSTDDFNFPTDVSGCAGITALNCVDASASAIKKYYRVKARNNGGDTYSNIINAILMPKWKEVIPR